MRRTDGERHRMLVVTGTASTRPKALVFAVWVTLAMVAGAVFGHIT